MGDQDFNFRPPTERREPKQFEPPPWERDAFDEMARTKAEQEAAEAEAAAAAEAELAREAEAEVAREAAPGARAEEPEPLPSDASPRRSSRMRTAGWRRQETRR